MVQDIHRAKTMVSFHAIIPYLLRTKKKCMFHQNYTFQQNYNDHIMIESIQDMLNIANKEDTYVPE